MLRNKTLVYQEDNSRWRSADLGVTYGDLIETDGWGGFPNLSVYFIQLHDHNHPGKPFSVGGEVC